MGYLGINQDTSELPLGDGLSMMQRMKRTGSFLPRGIAYATSIGGRLEMVTYAQLKASRIAKQQRHLERIISDTGPVRCAGYIWTFWTPGLGGVAYRGWWAYLWTIHDSEQLRWNGIREREKLIQSVMALYPCGLFPIKDNFEAWKEAFAREFAHPGRFKKQGLAKVWITRHGWDCRVEPA